MIQTNLNHIVKQIKIGQQLHCHRLVLAGPILNILTHKKNCAANKGAVSFL